MKKLKAQLSNFAELEKFEVTLLYELVLNKYSFAITSHLQNLYSLVKHEEKKLKKESEEEGGLSE